MLFPLAMTLCRLCRREHTERALEGALLVCQTAYLLMLGFDMPVY